MKDVYQFKITLVGSKPPIWRRVLVPSTLTLNQLHDVIQACFEWDHSHLYAFEINKELHDDEAPSTLAKKLNKLPIGVNSKFKYIYDFGDHWEHSIALEKILPADSRMQYPYCIMGARAAPPEDCGGIWGYEHNLTVLADKDHPEHAEILEWMGCEIDPEDFNGLEVNERLKYLR
jgi:hypothetical protein